MASRLFNHNLFLLRAPLFATGVGISSALLLHQNLHGRGLVRLDSSSSSVSPADWSFSNYQQNARVPVVRKDGRLNARAVRQLTAGSIMGELAAFLETVGKLTGI